MNKTESKLNLKTLLTFLTVLMLTFVMVFAIACNNNGGESTSESTSDSASTSESKETKTDNQTLKNGDFEFSSSSSFPATPSSWSYTTDGAPYATASTSSRGMIDTADEAYGKLSSNHKNTVNPKTPLTADDENTEANEAGTKILMLHSTEYTAHYYTSSTSLKLSAGQYGKLSVWVRTDGITTYLGAKAGAYIKVKNNVVSEDNATYDPLMIENIDTKGQWINYVIYLEPNQTKATTYTLVLGLGQGNKHNREKLCNGFAYFDSITFDYVSKEDYTTATATATVTKSATTANEDFIVDASAYTTKTTVNLSLAEGTSASLDVSGGNGAFNNVNINNPNGGHEIDAKGNAGYVTADTTVAGNTFKNAIYMDFSSLKGIGSSYTYTTKTFTLPYETYRRISFWAKISARNADTKATMSVYNVVNGEITGNPVATFDNVSTEDYENDKNGDFARYTFYLANNFPADNMEYAIKFSFGPTDRASVTDIKTLPIGYAIFKDFEYEDISEDNYSIADTSTDTRAKKGTLTGKYNNDYVEDEDEEESESKDSYSITVGTNASLRMEQGEIVNLNDLTSVNLYTPDSTTATVGVVNSKYASLYTNDNLKNALAFVKGKIQNENTDVQALLVQNSANEQVYVAANSVTVSAKSTYVFSVKVYAHGDAKAFVNLVNMGDASTSDKAVMSYNVKGDYKMEVEVSNVDCSTFLDGYAQVTFIVTAGKEPLNLRLEFGLNNAGVALFDSISAGTSSTSYSSVDSVKNAFEADYNFTAPDKFTQKDGKIYYYENETDAKNDTNRLKDDDGNDRYDVAKELEITTFGTVKNNTSSTAKLVQYYNFDVIKYVIEPAEVVEEEESTESTSDENVETVDNYGWLQVTSILIAIALIGALVAIIVRKSFSKKTSKKNKTKTYYHQGYNKNNRYSKGGDVAVPDAEDNEKEYDYDNPDNN